MIFTTLNSIANNLQLNTTKDHCSTFVSTLASSVLCPLVSGSVVHHPGARLAAVAHVESGLVGHSSEVGFKHANAP